MLREYVMGLDIGTTSVKACIFHLNGKVMAVAEKIIPTHYPQMGWVEQDPFEIERLSVLAIKESIQKAGIEKSELIGLGFSAAMHSLICVDQEKRPLSPALIWADGRGYPQAEKIVKTMGEQVFLKTGTPIHPMTPFVKLLWMKDTRYEPFYQADSFMSIKEFLLYTWFNKRIIDFSMSSATGLFNPKTLRWEQDLLEHIGISEDQLSKIVPPTTILTDIDKSVADEMGIQYGMPFVIGAADGQLANIGVGAILPGEVAISVGTSGAIRQFIKGVKISKQQETFCYSFTDETTIIGGPTNNGGVVLQWLKELLQDEGSYDSFLAKAEGIPSGSEGLLFVPYINGERAPIWNQLARGNFFGVSILHKKEHFIRATLEGITFNLYRIGKSLEGLAGAPEKIFVNGGLARSSLWLQILADVFSAEIYVPESYHSAAWGAAWTALVATGKVSSFEDIKKNIPMGKPILPIKENIDLYKKLFDKYQTLALDIEKFF